MCGHVHDLEHTHAAPGALVAYTGIYGHGCSLLLYVKPCQIGRLSNYIYRVPCCVSIGAHVASCLISRLSMRGAQQATAIVNVERHASTHSQHAHPHEPIALSSGSDQLVQDLYER